MQQNSNYKSKSDPCWATSGVAGSNRVDEQVGLYPNMSYWPVLGLVALLARVASPCGPNPRAPHMHP
jgi:hypothetical protein